MVIVEAKHGGVVSTRALAEMSVLLDKDGAPVSDGEEVIVNGGLDLSMGRKIKGAFSSLCKRKASYDTSLEDTAPRDSYHLVYICFLMAGVGFLIPWSAIIGAVDYFFYYYLQDFPSVSVVLPMSYLITTFFASTLNLVLVRVVPVHARISFGYVMFLVSLLLIPLLDVGIYNCAIPTTVSFYLTVVSVGLVGLGSGGKECTLNPNNGHLWDPKKVFYEIECRAQNKGQSSIWKKPRPISQFVWHHGLL